jgi:lysozyme family protein
VKDNYARCLDEVLRHEGGKVDHPKDPGGRTAYGVTQKTYNAWRTKNGAPTRDVFKITRAEIETIYRQEYWNRVRGDDLPAGVDLAIFDFAVNSGVSRASKYTQALVGAPQDGVIGPQTLKAIDAYKGKLNLDLCDKRMAFLKGLKTWPTFGRGWTARVNSVRKVSESMRVPPKPTMTTFEKNLIAALDSPTVLAKLRQILS